MQGAQRAHGMGFAWLRTRLEQVGHEIRNGTITAEDVLRTLREHRPHWRPQTWEEALLCDALWEPFKDGEAPCRSDPAVAAWVTAFAKAANLSPAQAMRVALLWCRDLAAAVAREEFQPGDAWRPTPFNLDALRFYYVERRSRIACQCWLADILDRDPGGYQQLRDKLWATRGRVIAALGDAGHLMLQPATGGTHDPFRQDRERQVVLEHGVLLRLLILLDRGGGARAGAALDDWRALTRGAAGLGASLLRPRDAARGQQRTEELRLRDACCIWGLQLLKSATAAEARTPGGGSPDLGDLAADVSFVQRVQGGDAESAARLAPLRLALLLASQARVDTAPLLSGAVRALRQLTMWRGSGGGGGGGAAAPLCGSECEYLRQAVCSTVRWALEWYCVQQRAEGGRAVAFPMSAGQCELGCPGFPGVHWSENDVLDATRALLMAAPPGHGVGASPVLPQSPHERTLQDYLQRAFGPLLLDAAECAMALFPASVRGSQALLEVVCASDTRVLGLWWDFLRRCPTLSVEMGPDSHQSKQQHGNNPWTVPDKAKVENMVAVAVDPADSHTSGPPSVGMLVAPVAPCPGRKKWQSDVAPGMQVRYGKQYVEAFEQLDSHAARRFVVWAVEPHAQGERFSAFLWMCQRCVFLIKFGRRAAEGWLPPYLDLVTAIVRTLRTFVCGPERAASQRGADPVEYFAVEGAERLQQIESDLQFVHQQVSPGVEQGWTLAELVGDLLVQMVDWPEAKCYAERAGLVQECAGLLGALLSLSRQILEPVSSLPVSTAVAGTVRSLFSASAQSRRPPLLQLFSMVESASKRCQCTLGVMSLVGALLRDQQDYTAAAGALGDVVHGTLEVFADACGGWEADTDHISLTAACLDILANVAGQAGIERVLADGSRPHEASALVGGELLHSDRTGRALLQVIGWCCSDIADVSIYRDSRQAVSVRGALATGLRLLEHALEAAAEGMEQDTPAPGLISHLFEACPAVPLEAGELFSIPALLFHLVSSGPEEPEDVRLPAARVFTLLCEVCPTGSLLRHVGGRAHPTGHRILMDLKGSWTRPEMDFSSLGPQLAAQMQEAWEAGLQCADASAHSMPQRYAQYSFLSDTWLSASTKTARLLAVLRMLRAAVSHQPQLFIEAFMTHGVESDPIGDLIRAFVLPPEGAERPAVREAVCALFAAAVEAQEPCRTMVLARSVPTMQIDFTVRSSGIGDILVPADPMQPECPWSRVPRAAQSDFAAVGEALRAAAKDAHPAPYCIFDRTRSWPYTRFARVPSPGDPDGDDVVRSGMVMVVGPVAEQPPRAAWGAVLQAAEQAVAKVFAAAGYADAAVRAGWRSDSPYTDPEVWPILSEALYGARRCMAHWMAGRLAERAGEMGWRVCAAAHTLRTVSVVCSAPARGSAAGTEVSDEPAALARAAKATIETVLGQWGQQDAQGGADGVLGMFVETTEEGSPVDGILGLAAGVFYGAVRVRQRQPGALAACSSSSTTASPQQRSVSEVAAYARRFTSPRKALAREDSPLCAFLSPMMRGAAASAHRHTPLHHLYTPAPRMAAATPSTAFRPFPSTPRNVAPLPVPSGAESEARITLYDLIQQCENEVRSELESCGVAGELASPSETSYPPAHLALAKLRGRRRPPGQGLAPAGAQRLLGSWIDLAAARRVYGQHPVLLEACMRLNDAAALGVAALYLLRSAVLLLSVLLPAPCPVKGHRRRLIPSEAIVRPADWEQRGPSDRPAQLKEKRREQPCLVRSLLERCLLHPPQRAAAAAGEPPWQGAAAGEHPAAALATLLDRLVRADATRVLCACVSELGDRSLRVARGTLDREELSSRAKQRYVTHGAIASSVLTVYRYTGALSAASSDTPDRTGSRAGHCTAGEADLLLTLCSLAEPDPSGGQSAGCVRPFADADPRDVFPHLHQYLAMPDGDQQLGGDEGDCYTAALTYLCTFGVPQGMELHAAQLLRTFLVQLGRLNEQLSCEGPAWRRQQLVGRAQRVLAGVRAIAGSPCGPSLMELSAAVPGLDALRCFAPPADDAAATPLRAARGPRSAPPGAAPRSPTAAGAVLPAHDRGADTAAVWVPLRVAVLSVHAAMLAAVEARPRPSDAAAASARLHAFCGSLRGRIGWLLSAQGLRSGCGRERTLILELLCGCARERLLASERVPLSASAPLFPWLIEALNAALSSLRDAVEGAAGQAIRLRLAAHPVDERTQWDEEVSRSHGTAPQQQRGESTAQFAERLMAEQQLYESLRLVLSLLGAHLLPFLPLASIAARCGGPSRAMRELLVALEEYYRSGGCSEAVRDEREEAVHAAARRAIAHAAEPGLPGLLRAAAQKARAVRVTSDRPKKPTGPPRLSYLEALSGLGGRGAAWQLRAELVAHYAPHWGPGAGARCAGAFYFTDWSPREVPPARPKTFAEVAVLGRDDDLSEPGAPLRQLSEQLCRRLCDIVTGEPADPPLAARRGRPAVSALAVAQAAARALAGALQLHDVYEQCLELAAPDDDLHQWAVNVLSRIDPAVNHHRHSGLSPCLRRALRERVAMQQSYGGHSEAEAALACYELRELARRHEREEGQEMPLVWQQRLWRRMQLAQQGPALGDNVTARFRDGSQKAGVAVGCVDGRLLVRLAGEETCCLVDSSNACAAAAAPPGGASARRAAAQRAQMRRLLGDGGPGGSGLLRQLGDLCSDRYRRDIASCGSPRSSPRG
eukprot:TRINITY_DN8442_c0_g1_i2.p1 TRINITY_DN8442_c0_g1~~TRINITY_DN8442_c0_g1_i2.p1  ORF type:complete len:2695 (+),score=865.77 TRINITY_DN8442_c0_g1_i2:101-8185(+)